MFPYGRQEVENGSQVLVAIHCASLCTTGLSEAGGLIELTKLPRKRYERSVTQTHSHQTAEGIFSLFNPGCSRCASVIEGRLKKLSGIKDVNVNYVTDTVQVSYDPIKITADDIRQFLKKLGHDDLTSHPEATTLG